MSKKVSAAVGKTQPKKKVWKAEDYATFLIPIEQVRDIKTAFDTFDSDLSGIVDPRELKRAFEQMGFQRSNRIVYRMLSEPDYEEQDAYGGIDFAEFLSLVTAKLDEKDSRAEIDRAWAFFDVNRSGKITVHELKKVAKELGEDLTEDEINHIFSKADLDEDGLVTSHDFYNIITHKVYWDQ